MNNIGYYTNIYYFLQLTNCKLSYYGRIFCVFYIFCKNRRLKFHKLV